MPDFALECFRCTQAGIEVTFLPSDDNYLRVRMKKGEAVIQEILRSGPYHAAMCLAGMRSRLVLAIEGKWDQEKEV